MGDIIQTKLSKALLAVTHISHTQYSSPQSNIKNN